MLSGSASSFISGASLEGHLDRLFNLASRVLDILLLSSSQDAPAQDLPILPVTQPPNPLATHHLRNNILTLITIPSLQTLPYKDITHKMASTRKGGGEATPGNTGKKPRKEKRQLVRWDRKSHPISFLHKSHSCITELLSQVKCVHVRFRPFVGVIHKVIHWFLSNFELLVLTILIEDLDTLLLLTVQSACNLTGVKVPWQKVAKLMGPKFTEGAIVQHLSKLRIRREAAGQRVPPPLRRSVTAAAAASGGKGGLKSGRKNTRKRKGRSDALDEDSSDGLDAQEEDDSDPEYIQNKKKHKARRSSFSTSKKTKLGLKDDDDEDDDDDALMCSGAPFLQHTRPNLESDLGDSDSEVSDDDDAALDLDDEFDSDSYAAKIKLEKASPAPGLSRVIKLPVSLRSRDQDALKSIRSVSDNTPPPSSQAGTWNQSYAPNDPAMMNNNMGSMYGPQGPWYPGQMATSQGNENPFQTAPGHMYWPMPTPVVNNRILAPNDFTWSPHTPAFASGRGGTLAVSGHPVPSWASATATAGESSSQAMDPASWFLNSNVFDPDDDIDAKENHGQDQGGEY